MRQKSLLFLTGQSIKNVDRNRNIDIIKYIRYKNNLLFEFVLQRYNESVRYFSGEKSDMCAAVITVEFSPMAEIYLESRKL